MPLNCAGTKPPSYELSFHQSNLFGKQILSSHVSVHVGVDCSTIHYCDESLNDAEVSGFVAL